MLAVVPSATLHAVDGIPVAVEAHVTDGLPSMKVVGSADPVCRESRDRVRAAMVSSKLWFPHRKVTVNLAPSWQRKVGPALDLAIALALLAATDQLPPGAVGGVGALAELGLDGTLRPVVGMVPLAAAVQCDHLIVPAAQAAEAELGAPGLVRPVRTLGEAVGILRGGEPWPSMPPRPPARPRVPDPDLADVRGQTLARRALEVAAAGGHNILLAGPPGAGKTMLAERLPGLMPDLDDRAALEVTRIHSAAGILDPNDGLVRRPPYQAPHQTASAVSVLGGGSGGVLRPGALSCAHRGVLFLDEVAEFPRTVLDALRQPLEEGVMRVHRSGAWAVFPARVQLVAAMNPCPCGNALILGQCKCSTADRTRSLRRLSSPMLDRLDIRLVVDRADPGEVLKREPGEPTAAVLPRVVEARRRAEARGVASNAAIAGTRLDDLAPLLPAARHRLEESLRAGRLSARGLHRVRRLALTLADLSGHEPPLTEDHIGEALGMRVELTVAEAA